MRRLPWHAVPWGPLAARRPRGFHPDVDAYLASGAAASADTSAVIYPQEQIRRSLPQAFGGALPACFADACQARVPAARVHQFHGVRFWGHYGGSLIGRDNRLLADLSPDVWTLTGHRALSIGWLPRPSPLAGTTAVVTTAEAASNYWHWMMDALPRFHLLEKAGFGPDKVDRYLTNARLTAFQLETLQAIGVPKQKLLQAGNGTHLELEHAVVPSIREVSWDLPSWQVNLPVVPAAPPPEGPGRSGLLYFSREGEARRRLACEAELVPALRERGFLIVRATEHPVAVQKALAAGARLIVAPHGAALTNLLFARPGTVVLDLMSAAWPALFFWSLSEARGLRHCVLMDRNPAGPRGRDEDIHLGSAEILAAVDGLLASHG